MSKKTVAQTAEPPKAPAARFDPDPLGLMSRIGELERRVQLYMLAYDAALRMAADSSGAREAVIDIMEPISFTTHEIDEDVRALWQHAAEILPGLARGRETNAKGTRR